MPYHLDTQDYIPQRCDNDPCPLGKNVTHYESREEAFEAYYQKLENAEKNYKTNKSTIENGNADFSQSGQNIQHEEHIEKLPAEFKNIDHCVSIEPGKYWFGDPCYPLGNDPSWDEWVDETARMTHDYERPLGGAIWDHIPLFAASTAIGDGVYKDNDKNIYSVDGGAIAPVPERIIADKEWNEKLGRWVILTKVTRFEVVDGVIKLGDIIIDTNN